MPTIELTDAEAAQIAKQRERADRCRWIVEGMFLAAGYLTDLGDQCAGGSGAETNPETGKPYGAAHYEMANVIQRRAAYLSSNPAEINV